MDSRSDVKYESQQHAVLVAAHDDLHVIDDLMTYVRRYAREKPESIAYLCFGVGFILGWKLKPW